MTQLYEQALAAVRRSYANHGNNDTRQHPRYLERAQAGWKLFVEDHCTVTGAFGGGSNPSISDRENACYEHELDRRIEYLRDLASQTGQFGV